MDTFDPSTVAWAMGDKTFEYMKEAILASEEIVIDLETTGLNEYAVAGGQANGGYPARIVLAALTLPTDEDLDKPLDDAKPATWVLPLSHPDSPWVGCWRDKVRELCEIILESGKPLTNQNLKFDLRWLYAHSGGIDLTAQFEWDTQIGSHLLNETVSTSLKDRVPMIFGVKRWDDFDLSTPGAAERVPLVDLALYGARDTYWTWKLAQWQRYRLFLSEDTDGVEPYPEEIQDARIGRLARLAAMPTSQTLTQIEQRGFGLDTKFTSEKIIELEASRDSDYEILASQKFAEGIEGSPSFAPTSKWFKEWASRAVDNKELEILAMTGGGNPQWNQDVLSKLARDGNTLARDLLSYRKATKSLEFLNSWLSAVTPQGKIHTTYHAGRVLTGRLSSSGPNVQQITSSLRPAFIPRPGFVIADLDYSQIELRIAAEIAQCAPMIEAFLRGDDLHSLLAAEVNKKDVDLVTKDERQAGKSGNFGFLYGMSENGFQLYADSVYGVSFSDEESASMRQAFFTQWDGIEEWHRQAVIRARRDGAVVSPLGRVRRLPEIDSYNDRLRSHAERQAINAPVQSMASDVMQIAAASISGNLEGVAAVPDVRLIATVHDSIVMEVPEDNWKRPVGLAMRRMMGVTDYLKKMDCHIAVPLAVEASVGTRWGLSDVGTIS